MDHILHPTITDASFVTEVHHINGAGEDAGVVYSEMQARENSAGDLMALQYVLQFYVTSRYAAYRKGSAHALSSILRISERDGRTDVCLEGVDGRAK